MGQNYVYHFTIKELAKEIEGKFYLCTRTWWRIHNFFSQWQKDLLRIERNRKEISKTISYKLQFIDSARFKASLLPNLVDNLAEGIHKVNGKMNAIVKKYEMCGIKYRKCYWFFEYPKVQDDLILCKCLYCNRNYDDVLKNRFVDTYNILRISTSLFCCCRKVFTYMNEWMIEKKLMKH